MLNILQYLNQLAKYFGIEGVKLSIDEDMSVLCMHKGQKVNGISNTVQLFEHLSKSPLSAKTHMETALIYQWIEHIILNYVPKSSSAEKASELNTIFANRTFLVEERKTVADILLYLVAFELMETFSYLEKEKYVHFSRWFDNIQQEAQLRQKNKTIDFSTNYLVSKAPARH